MGETLILLASLYWVAAGILGFSVEFKAILDRYDEVTVRRAPSLLVMALFGGFFAPIILCAKYKDVAIYKRRSIEE